MADDGAEWGTEDYNRWLSEQFPQGLSIEDIGIDGAVIEETATDLISACVAGTLSTRIDEVRSKLIGAAEASFRENGAGLTASPERLQQVVAECWGEFACDTAHAVLNRPTDIYNGPATSTQSGADGVPTELRVADALIAGSILSSARSLFDLDGQGLPHSFHLFSAFEHFVHSAAVATTRLQNMEVFRLGLVAASLYVSAVRRNNSFQFYLPCHEALAKMYRVLPSFAEAVDMAPLVSQFAEYTHVRANEDGAGLSPAAASLPTVRNMLVHFAIESEVEEDSLDSVNRALDKIEEMCGTCVSIEGCGEPVSGCHDRTDQAQSCSWLIGTYVDCLSSLWELVRSPEPLDHAVALAEERYPDDDSMLNKLVSLRCVRFAAYRGEDDRAKLNTVFARTTFTHLSTWQLSWLMSLLPGNHSENGGIALAALGLEPERTLLAICEALHRAQATIPIAERIALWVKVAKTAMEHFSLPSIALHALDQHWKVFDELYRLSGLGARSDVVVEARRDATPLHASLMASVGRCREAVERIEVDRFNELRDDVTFLGFRFRDVEASMDLARDYLRLQGLQKRLDNLATPVHIPIAEGDRIAMRISVHRQIDEVRGRIAARTALPTYRNPAGYELVQQRAAISQCPVVYLWSTDEGGHLLVANGTDEPRYASLPRFLAPFMLDPLINGLRASMASYRAKPSLQRRLALGEEAADAIRTCLELGLGDGLADNVTGRRCLLIPVGAWHALPIHLASHMDISGRLDIPIISYAATGVATGSRPQPKSFPSRPSIVIADLTPGTAPLFWARAEGRMVAAALGKGARLFHGEDLDDETTVARFIQHHPDCAVVHIAGHTSGHSRGRLSQAASVMFGAGNGIDSSFLKNQLRGIAAPPSLWFFSACESGGISDDYFDEVHSLQGAALVMGVPDVVVTQWPVGDLAAAIFASRFYDEMIGGGFECWEATFRAREWLLNLTESDGLEHLRSHGIDATPGLSEGGSLLFPDTWSWAPFVHYQGW